jgi:hypothetical protein
MTIFYPAYNLITAITNAENAVISLQNTNDLTVGQVIRILVPNSYGMKQINKQTASILIADPAFIVVNINTTAYDVFAVPSMPLNQSFIIPIGETANEEFANNLDDATVNIL